MAWLIVFCRGETKYVKELKGKEWLFLILSGLATGASWLCYYYAIQQGQVSIVVPTDKLSILITVLFSLVVFKEKLNLKEWIGLALLTAGTVLMAESHDHKLEINQARRAGNFPRAALLL